MKPQVDLLHTITSRLLAELDSRPESGSRIARRSGLNPRYFSGLRRNPANITLASFLNICRELEIEPSAIIDVSQTIAVRAIGEDETAAVTRAALPKDATLDSLLDQWADANGEIRKFDAGLLRHVVLFRPPQKGRPLAHRLGRQSFAAEVLENKTVSGLQDLIDNSQKMLVDKLASSHFQALQGKPILSIESGRIVWSDGVSAAVDYVRLLLPVKDESGAYYILSYSKQIGTRQKPAKNPSEGGAA